MSELHTKFGALLKLERERQGTTLADISVELKIPEDTLLQIEVGDINALPSELYFKLFAKSYAEYLGIDYGKTVEAIREEIGEALEPLEPDDIHKKEKTRRPDKPDSSPAEGPGDPNLGSFVKRAGILAGIIVGAFVIVLVGYQLFFSSDTSPDEAERGDSSHAGLVHPSESDPASDISNASEFNWNIPTYQQPDSIRLTLVAREESWATVVADGDTTTRLYQTLVPGQQYVRTAKYRLRVSIGIPRLVDINLDGKPAYLANPETGRISQVEINQTNRDKFGSPPQPRVNTRTAPASAPEGRSVTIDSSEHDNVEII